jgi:hypothetical protein
MAVVVPRKHKPLEFPPFPNQHDISPSLTVGTATTPETSTSDVSTAGPGLRRKHSNTSAFRKFFKRRGSGGSENSEKKTTGEKKMDEKSGNQQGDEKADDATAYELDTSKPLGIITLEDVLEELIGEGTCSAVVSETTEDGRRELKRW